MRRYVWRHLRRNSELRALTELLQGDCSPSQAILARRAPFDLTNRWSQLRKYSRARTLAVVKSTFDFMKQFQMLATLIPASGGSALSRYAR
jgi:hypothetical protein